MAKDRSASQIAETRSRIERWLSEMDYVVTPLVREELVWGVIGERPKQVGIAVGQIVRYTDRVYLQSGYLLEDAFKDRIALLEPEERRELIWDIRFLLLPFDTPFDGVEEPLTLVNFSDSIFIEALNRTTFQSAIFRIQRSYIAMGWALQRKFPDVKLDEVSPGTGGTGFIN